MIGFPAKYGKLLHAFTRDDSGATAIEYALIGTGISVAIIIGFTSMGTSLNTMYNAVAAKIVLAIT